MTLTIYSKDYDKDEVVNDGYSNFVYVEDKESGIGFSKKDEDNLERAIKYIVSENINVDEIIYNYNENGEKRFKRFNVKNV